MTKNTKLGDKFYKDQEVCTFLIISKDNHRKWKEIISIACQQRIFEVKLLKKIATTYTLSITVKNREAYIYLKKFTKIL